MAGIILLAMVLLAGSAGAATNINSCQDITAAGEYVLNASINSGALSCINIISSDVIFDGAGYTIDGTGVPGGIGVYVHNSTTPLSNVTVKNLSVTKWYGGIYLDSSSNSTLTGNNASSNGNGIFLNSSSNSTLTGNNASSNTYGIYLQSSNNNNLTGNNASSNSVYGILLRASSNNNLTGNNASSNSIGFYLYSSSNNNLTGNNASSNTYGILLGFSSNNNLTGNNASSNDVGILLRASSNNNLIGNNASSNDVGIHLLSSSNNNLTGNKASNNTLWAFYSESNSINNTVINLTINPTISFTSKDLAINSAPSPAPDPAGYKNISKFINATNNSADSWLFLKVSYSASDVAGLNESSLRMWRYEDSAWSLVPDPNNVDTQQKYVYANITAFSIFAPMGQGLPKTPAKVPALNPAGLVALAGALSFAAIGRIRRRGE